MSKKVTVPTQATRMGRAAARKQIGKLKHQVISEKTERRYELAYQSFLQFHQLDRYFQLPPLELLDDMVAEYVEYLWEDGQTKSQANYTLAAIQFFRPQTKQHLPWAWKLAKTWNQVEIPCRVTPLDPDTLLAFAGLAFKWKEPIFGHLYSSSVSPFSFALAKYCNCAQWMSPWALTRAWCLWLPQKEPNASFYRWNV